MNYTDELTRAVELLARNDKVVFLGQGIKYPGHGMTRHFQNVDVNKLIEMPVAEELQLGISLGMAITGQIPVSIFPRWNFLILAANQLVNHLDKFGLMTEGKLVPKVIIKVGVGSERPLFPGHQHIGDFSEAFRLMLKNIEVTQLHYADQIVPAYKRALDSEGSSIIVEFGDLYEPPTVMK